MMNENIKNSPPKKGMSTGAKWGIGCGSGCLVLIIVIPLACFIGYRVVKGKIDTMATELKDKHGFEYVVKGQTIVIDETITKPTLYMGQMVKIHGDCTTNLAVMAQMCELYGAVEGKMYFRGQILTIKPEAHLKDGLDVFAQMVQNQGTIDGKITGSYQTIQNTRNELKIEN